MDGDFLDNAMRTSDLEESTLTSRNWWYLSQNERFAP